MTEQSARGPDREAVKVVLSFYKAFNARDMDTILSLISEDHVDYTYFGRDPIQPEAIGRAFRGMLDTFPDWKETVDEIIPGEDGKVTVRATGRGTQKKDYMGKKPTGKQVAASYINVLTIKNGKITEYRSTFPFTTPDEEPITGAEDIQVARAEQGGLRITQGNWESVLDDYAEGRIALADVGQRKGEVAEEAGRCQTLLAENMRRCINPAESGSLYCSEHQEAGERGGFGLDG